MTNREQMIRELQERLQWLENNASDEDYNAQEEAAIQRLLDIVDPPELNLDDDFFSPEKALERFWSGYDSRVAMEQEREKLLAGKGSPKDASEEGDAKEADAAAEKNGEEAGAAAGKDGEDAPGREGKSLSIDGIRKNGILAFCIRHKAMAAAVVVLVLALTLLIGGTAGVYAQRQIGIFNMLGNDKDKIQAVVVPETVGMNEDVMPMTYASIEEIDEDYRDGVCLPQRILDTYIMNYISVISFADYVQYEAYYYDKNTDKYIECMQIRYHGEIFYTDIIKDGYALIIDEKNGNIEIEYYKNDNDEYIIRFFYKNDMYMIFTNVDDASVKSAGRELLTFVKGKNN